jgi:hypothetical protein
MRATREDVRNVELVTRGYTVSVETAALGRIGEHYVMRDRQGHRIALPLAVHPKHLLQVWAAFRRAIDSGRPMPARSADGIVLSSSVEWRPVGDDGFATGILGDGAEQVSVTVEYHPDGLWEWLAWQSNDPGSAHSGSPDGATRECRERDARLLPVEPDARDVPAAA